MGAGRLALRELLELNLGFDPEYGAGLLTNHLSMCLIALDRLGAPPQRLKAFFESHTGSLVPLHDDGGRRAALLRRLRDQGRAPLLRERLAELAPGLAGAAFHGLIRLAYALEADLDAELAHALGYFEECRMTLEAPDVEPDADDPVALLEEVHALRLPRPAAPNIAIRMQAAFAIPAVAQAAGRLRVDAGTLERLAAAALRLYAGSDDFTALHAVTACHASRLLVPHVDATTLARCLWPALLAAYVSTGSPRLPDDAGLDRLRARGAPGWDEVAAAATRSDDDHVVKIGWSCRSEDAAYGDPLYRVVAWRAAERGSA